MVEPNDEHGTQAHGPDSEPMEVESTGCVYRVLAAIFVLFMCGLAYTLLRALVR